MNEATLKQELQTIADNAKKLGYTVNLPELFIDPIFGNRLAYYQHGTNKIVIHDHFVETADKDEIVGTLIHELAHAIAEQNNTTDKRIWHGDVWKEINATLGGNSERYHQGTYHKPAPVKKSMKELYSTLPKHPANRWERGTYNQWLSRGYHVIKGQKGQLSVWEFSADEYETDVDGKSSTWGRASAVYFTPDQVEPNTLEEKK